MGPLNLGEFVEINQVWRILQFTEKFPSLRSLAHWHLIIVGAIMVEALPKAILRNVSGEGQKFAARDPHAQVGAPLCQRHRRI